MPSGLWVTMPRDRGSHHATYSVRGEAAGAPHGSEQWVPQRAGWRENRAKRWRGKALPPLGEWKWELSPTANLETGL